MGLFGRILGHFVVLFVVVLNAAFVSAKPNDEDKLRRFGSDLSTLNTFVQLKRKVPLNKLKNPPSADVQARARSLNREIKPEDCTTEVKNDTPYTIGQGDQQMTLNDFTVIIGGETCPFELTAVSHINQASPTSIDAKYTMVFTSKSEEVLQTAQVKSFTMEGTARVDFRQEGNSIEMNSLVSQSMHGDHLTMGEFKNGISIGVDFGFKPPFSLSLKATGEQNVIFESQTYVLRSEAKLSGIFPSESYTLNGEKISKQTYEELSKSLQVLGTDEGLKATYAIMPLSCQVKFQKQGEWVVQKTCEQNLEDGDLGQKLIYTPKWVEFGSGNNTTFINYDEPTSFQKMINQINYEVTCTPVDTCEEN